jgi:hypothetical protein
MSSNDIKYPKWEEHKVKYAPVNDKYKPSREQ